MKRLALRFLVNYLAFASWSVALLFLLLASPHDFIVFRNLQRAVDPVETVCMGVEDRPNGRRELRCLLYPGARQATLQTKLELAKTLLLLDRSDIILEQYVSPGSRTANPQQQILLGTLSMLLFGCFLGSDPVGRLARCWRTRQQRPSQVKFALACAALLSPLLSRIPAAVSNRWLKTQVSAVVGQPHQTSRLTRNGHRGIVVVVYTPAERLREPLARALQLGPQDRLSFAMAPCPLVESKTDRPSALPAVMMVLGLLLWCCKTTPREKRETLEFFQRLWLRIRSKIPPGIRVSWAYGGRGNPESAARS